MTDLRQALRSLSKRPAFAAVAILTLAFGVGVNVTLFGIISAMFLQPLPVPEPERLVLVMQRGGALNVPFGHSYPDYRDYRDGTPALSHLAAYMPTPVHLAVPGGLPERTWVEVVSPNYFEVGGASPAHGRFPDPRSDAVAAGQPSIVLSHRYWTRRLGGDPSIVGRMITINGRDFTVIGIAPERFTGLSWAMAVSAFIPADGMGALMENGDSFRENRAAHAWRLMGRLAPDRTLGDARREVEVVAARVAAAYPAEHRNNRVFVMPEKRSRPDPAIAEFLPVFAVVFAAMAALVLLIACANVANLVLSRAIERRHELVIRSALGASRRRLVRLLLIETLVLAVSAGALGLLLSAWAGAAITSFTPTGEIPINEHEGNDWRALVFTGFISVMAAVLTGGWPALKATGFTLMGALKDGPTTTPRSRHALRNLLVIGQVTLSLVVLVSSGLFLQSLRQLNQLDTGFTADGVYMMDIDLGLQQYGDARGLRFLEDLLHHAAALPGVTSVTAASHVPFDHGAQFVDVGLGDAQGDDGYVSSAYTVVAPRLFETLEIPVVRGRALDARDTSESRRVAVVNETLARLLWPGEDAVGRRFRLGRNGDWVEVVGVTRAGRYVMLAEQPRPYLYLPLAQRYRSPVHLLARSASDPTSLAVPMQRLLRERDPALPVFNARTMTQHMQDSVFALMPVRTGATLAAVQGLIGLFLAVLGLYAVVSSTVTRRVREIGVRMALGANPRHVVGLVIRDGLRLCLIGIGIGWVASAGIGFLLSRILHGLPPIDASVIGAVTMLLLIVAAAACYVPARRATRVDVLTSLRVE